MPVYQPSGTDRFVYDFQYKNRRYYGPCDTTNRVEAKRVEREKRREAEAGLGPDQAADMTIDAACAKWFDDVGQHLDAKKDYERSLDLIVDCVGARTKLREIDSAKVAQAIAARRLIPAEFRSKDGVTTRPVKNSTVNRQIVDMLRRILRTARTNWGARNMHEIDWKALRLNEGKKREREISDEEHDRLETAILRDYWKDFRGFLATYGVRLDEMFFDPEDVYDVDGQVSIRIRERKDGSTYVLVLMAEDGRLMLARKSRAIAAKLDTVWYREKKGKLIACTYSGARSALRRAIKRAGIRNLTIHDHRHDVATKLAREAGIVIAQAQLGHSDISTTRRYVKVSTKDRLDALSRVKSREKSRDETASAENPEDVQGGGVR